MCLSQYTDLPDYNVVVNANQSEYKSVEVVEPHKIFLWGLL